MEISVLWTAAVALCAGIVSIVGAVKVIKPIITKPFDELSSKLTKFAEESAKSDKEIKDGLNSIDEQVATMQHEKMMWAYSYYGLKRHPISLESRTSLCEMYKQYTEKGKHNHIPSDFADVIRSSPIEGIERSNHNEERC